MIRPLKKSDLARICEIEQSVHVVPWAEETFKLCFQQGYLSWAYEEEQKVVGFVIISLTFDECHVLNVAIAREAQRKGHGEALMEHVIDFAKKEGASVIYLEVRRSNARAIALYRKMHFHQIGERKDYYPTFSGHEDALIFAKTLQDAASISDSHPAYK